MNTLLNLGSRIIALEHIVMAEYEPGHPGGEEYFDEETEQAAFTKPRQAKLDLTLTSLHLETYDSYDGDPRGFASASDHLMLYGRDAEELAIVLQSRSVIVNLEAKQDAA